MTEATRELLHRHGMNVTAQRLAIMQAVSEHPHATADVIADEVRASIGSVSRQAVYDSLGMLVDKQLLRPVHPLGTRTAPATTITT